jgi:glycopeptide antibiotics resistance protein
MLRYLVDFDGSIVLTAAIGWIPVAIFLRRKRKKSLVFLIFITAFFFYLVRVVGYTQFPLIIGTPYGTGQSQWMVPNIIPVVGLGYRDFQSSLFGVLLMIPFGCGLPLITSLGVRGTLIAGLGVSLSMEVLQLASDVLFIHHQRADINDVLFNVTGVLIGYLLFLWFVWMLRLAFHRFNLPPNPLLLHVIARPQLRRQRADARIKSWLSTYRISRVGIFHE